VFFSARLQPAYAQTIDWTGNSDGETYQIAENWYGMNIPDTSGENARFNVGADFDVTFGSGSSTTINDLLVWSRLMVPMKLGFPRAVVIRPFYPTQVTHF
jgi:hypothetical protein